MNKTIMSLLFLLALGLVAQAQTPPAPRVVDLKASDGTILKGSYFAAPKPGPGAIFYHQSNRTRESWASVAAQLAAAGINVLTVDHRGHGESGGKSDKGGRDDIDSAFQFLISQPGVNREVIGMGGAGSLGVENATETARRHPQQVKSLVLLSGEAFRPQDQFLHQATQLPGLYVFSDEDEYPPTEEAMQLMYANAASPAKKLVHYSAVEKAPWLWYETSDASRVQAHGGHGTDLFQPHPELSGIIVHWFVTTLLKAPGHAPADPIAAAPILNDVEFDGGAARAEQKLREARQKDPQAQLWPEISMAIVGLHFLREGEVKSAIEVLKLNLLAYPDSADATENIAEAYLAAGGKVEARQAAQKSIEMLDSRKAPASTWTDTEQYRGEIREGAQKVLKQVDAKAMPTSERSPGSAAAPRVVDLKTPDGTFLKASYFAAAKPGPGALLFHQSNRTRSSWEGVAGQLAAAGIHTLTVDMRGHGETGGNCDNWSGPNWKEIRNQWWPRDLDTAFQYLVSQPGVTRDVIGVGGAGLLGVDNSVETARRHPDQVKSLALLSGETLRDGLQFLRQASQLPELFVVSDDDEYPPTQQAMALLYVTASSPSKKLVHYSAAKDAPWLWYEPFDIGKVPAKGGHGTDLFKVHPELPDIIVDWLVTTLIKTPGHAPADSLACAATLNQLQVPAGASEVAQQLGEARNKNPQAQLFPEITASIVGQDFMRDGDVKSAIDVLKLVVLAYPDSADADENLSEAYLKDEQKDFARQYAEKALAILNDHKIPASSWTDTEQYRGEIRRGAEKVIKQLVEKQG